ncbi:MAG: hypothetical protein ACI4U3_06090 [Traorella sp.]
MEEKLKMMKKVGLYSIIITLVVMVISLIFKDKTITLGIGLGCMIGLIGFNMILQFGYRNEETGRKSGFMNYMSRYLFYICMFVLCAFLGANILSLLVGFMCHKVAIYVYSLKEN